MRIKKKTILYAAGVLACGNLALQALGFFYRVLLSHFAGAEGLGVYRLVNSAYLVLNAGCLSGVTMACSRLSAACEARGEGRRIGAILRLAFSVFFTLCAVCAAVVLLFGNGIAVTLLGDGRCAKAFPFVLLCLALTGVENIFKSLFIGLEQMQYTATSEVGEQLIRIFSVGILLYRYQGEDYGTIAMLIFAGMVVSEVFSALFLTRLFRRSMAHTSLAAPLDRATAQQFFFIEIAELEKGQDHLDGGFKNRRVHIGADSAAPRAGKAVEPDDKAFKRFFVLGDDNARQAGEHFLIKGEKPLLFQVADKFHDFFVGHRLGRAIIPLQREGERRFFFGVELIHKLFFSTS